MATKKATKKSTTRTASKTGAKKSSKSGRKGSKGGKGSKGRKKLAMGEPIIVGGGGGSFKVEPPLFIRFPNKFRDNSGAGEKDFYSNDRRVLRVKITGDIKDYDEETSGGNCRIKIWFSGT